MRTSPLFATAFLLGLASATGQAAEPVSAADRSFVAMVSQGGMFEVQAGTLAAVQGSTQDIRDQGTTEQHDHGLVGDKLKSTAAAAGIGFSAALNQQFSRQLAALKAVQGSQFDALYLQDMEDIHAKDGAAFAKEASAGTNPGLRAFAAETQRIVLRHSGELHAVGPAKN